MSDAAYREAKKMLNKASSSLGLDTDILVECFAGLVAEGELFATDDIHIIPSENPNRNFRNDITALDHDSDGKRSLLKISTSRPNILDYLPENFYILPDERFREKESESNEERKKRHNRYKEFYNNKLESARKFFIPLEVAYNKVRLKRELDELDMLERSVPLFQELWQEFPSNTDAEKRFIKTLHLLKNIIGDIQKTKILIEYVLGYNVKIDTKYLNKQKLDTEELPHLKGAAKKNGSRLFTLGDKSTLGRHIYHYRTEYVLTILNVSKEDYALFKDKQSELGALIENIKDYYFPLDVDVQDEYVVSSGIVKYPTKSKNTELYIAGNQWVLSPNKHSGNSVLGSTTHLGKPKLKTIKK